MQYLPKKLFIFFALGTYILSASDVGLNINSNDLEIQSSTDIFSSYDGNTNFSLDMHYLHTQKDNLASLGFSGKNSFQNIEGLSLAFGAKAVLANKYMALPLFAKADFILPLSETIPTTSLITTLAYAPSVLSFSNAQSYTEFRIEADIEIVSNIHLFTGYRNIDTQYNSYDKLFNNSFYGGMKLHF